MPCGKRPIRKLWDKPKHIRVITPSKYEQNEASVKVHWRNVIKALELSYKDEQQPWEKWDDISILTPASHDQFLEGDLYPEANNKGRFWETQVDIVRDLVGPTIFQRLAKIFDLPLDATKYAPASEPSTTLIPSDQFYVTKSVESDVRAQFSISDYEPTVFDEEQNQEESELWTSSTIVSSSLDKRKSTSKAYVSSRSVIMPKSLSKLLSKSFSRFISKTLSTTMSERPKDSNVHIFSSPGSSANTQDDLDVQTSSTYMYQGLKVKPNPHYDMLYCNESETDMIKWKSNYKQKVFEVSASDEFSKKAEILTKRIAKEFYDWWVDLGNVEFKSEIKRSEDIETLFQVWFDEHASRGLMLNPKIIPCVLKNIAYYTGARKAACPDALKRQIAYDIKAETSPAHTMAFGTSLPEKIKHIPPQNNTENMWHGVNIPEDLRTMACVWDDIQHLTSTKAFKNWLQEHPNMPMPPCLKDRGPGDKKQLFVVPSDYVLKDKLSSHSTQQLALPVSQFSLELKQVLSKLMNE